MIHHDISRYIGIWEEREERSVQRKASLNCVFLLKLAARHSVCFVFFSESILLLLIEISSWNWHHDSSRDPPWSRPSNKKTPETYPTTSHGLPNSAPLWSSSKEQSKTSQIGKRKLTRYAVSWKERKNYSVRDSYIKITGGTPIMELYTYNWLLMYILFKGGNAFARLYQKIVNHFLSGNSSNENR